MLTVLADAIMRSGGVSRWDAPDYFKKPRSGADHEIAVRDCKNHRRRAMRGVGLL
jgi:hypothetical protein